MLATLLNQVSYDEEAWQNECEDLEDAYDGEEMEPHDHNEHCGYMSWGHADAEEVFKTTLEDGAGITNNPPQEIAFSFMALDMISAPAPVPVHEITGVEIAEAPARAFPKSQKWKPQRHPCGAFPQKISKQFWVPKSCAS